jgi:uncharacterized protein YutE (UPF0331/DUF86 family)
MSKTTFNKILAKLERLDEYLGYLKEIQKVNKKSFINDFHFYGLAERYLQLIIEVTIDVGKLLIIEQKLKKPEENSEIFPILFDQKIISRKLVNNLIGITNFRNILVHEYEKIDREIIYQKMQKNLDDFQQFKKEILKFLNAVSR